MRVPPAPPPLRLPLPPCSPVHQDGPLGLGRGVGAGGRPAVVQDQHQVGVRLLQEANLHVDGVPEHPHQGVVAVGVVGAVALVWGKGERLSGMGGR